MASLGLVMAGWGGVLGEDVRDPGGKQVSGLNSFELTASPLNPALDTACGILGQPCPL